jgi:tetratricopeptide (TPR) repeat protein
MIFTPKMYAQKKGIMIMKPNLHLQKIGNVVKKQILLERAQERFYQGLYEDAIRDLNNYIDQTGDKFGNAYYLRACCKSMINEKDETALRDINEAIDKQEKSHMDTYFSLNKKGYILEGLGNDETTIQFYKEMVAIERKKPTNQFLLLKAAAYNSLSNLYRFSDLDLALYYSKKSIETMSDAYITFYENLLSIYGQIINSVQTYNTSKTVAKLEICDYYKKAEKAFPNEIKNISILGVNDIKAICK